MSWSTVPLGDIATWGSGGTPKRSERSYFGPGVPWLSISDLNDGPVRTAKESLTLLGVAKSAAKVVPPGTVLVAMYGSIGKLGLAEREFCTSQAIAFAIPDSKRVDTRYLFHFLLAQRPKLLALGRGGTQMNIGQADLKAWPMPLPPLEEQGRIADILDRADTLRAKRREALALLDDLTQSIFLDMFGDPAVERTIWPVHTIGDLLESAQYGTSAKAGSQGSHAVLRMGNVTYDGKINLSDLKYIDIASRDESKYTVRDGDLLFNRTNSAELVGKTAVYRGDEPMAYAGYLVRLRPRELHVSEYLSAFLNSRYGKAVLRGMAKSIVGMANINAKEVQSIELGVPPAGMQETFTDRVARLHAVHATQMLNGRAMDKLFASVQQRAFAGLL